MAINELDTPIGYTNDFYETQEDIRKYARFLAILINLKLMSVRNAQILSSNHAQRKFEELRGDI